MIKQGFNILMNSDINLLILQGSQGIGKSHTINECIKGRNDCILFEGNITEASFWDFIKENRDKTIIMRDCSSLMKSTYFLDFLKGATEIKKVRKIARRNKSKENKEQEIEFSGKIIWETNKLPHKNREDLNAVINRSIFIDLLYSRQEISQMMRDIAQTKNEKEITEYLIGQSPILGSQFNLRTQKMCCQIGDINQIKLFLKEKQSVIQKTLYMLNGEQPLKRSILVKSLVSDLGWSKATAERRVTDALELGEIKSNNLSRNSSLQLK